MNPRVKSLLPLLVFLLGVITIPNIWRIELWLNPVEHQGKLVYLYSTSWCPYCAEARTFLEAAKIPFIEQDIEKSQSARRQYESYNGRGVPLLVIGRQAIQGFDRKRLREHLENNDP